MSNTLDIALKQARARRELPTPYQRRRLRQKAGLTQREIAEAVGVRRATIAAYEAGRRTPRAEALANYRRVLVRLADLERDTPPVAADGASDKTGEGGLDDSGYCAR